MVDVIETEGQTNPNPWRRLAWAVLLCSCGCFEGGYMAEDPTEGSSEAGEDTDRGTSDPDRASDDDGQTSADDDPDGTSDGGTDQTCGNGIVEGDEQCDDANALDTDSCPATCRSAVCGDGFVWAGVETCDDGLNDGSYGGCEASCQAPGPHCGDGIVNGSEFCDDANSEIDDGCFADCTAPTSCADIIDHDDTAVSGLYRIDPDGSGATEAYDVYCEMDLDGGGWTLAVVSSDDGQDTFSWSRRSLWTTDHAVVGDPSQREYDFKSPVLHDLRFADLLVVHAPSDVWAAYAGAGTGERSLAAHLEQLADGVCYGTDPGLAMTAGTLAVAGNLCSTDLFINAIDQDGTEICTSHDDSMGPAWSSSNNASCPLDDVGHYGFGPNRLYPDIESNASSSGGLAGQGFGGALGLNSGALGTGENRISLYVR